MAESNKNIEVLSRAFDIVKRTKDIDQFKQAQAFLLPYEYGLTLNETALVLGISHNWVYQLRRNFINGFIVKCGMGEQAGGRRRQNMTVPQEKQFLKPYFQIMDRGHQIKVAEVKHELELFLGRKVALSSVYNLLKRHNLTPVKSKS